MYIYSYHSQHPLKIQRPRLHPGNPLVPALGRLGSHNWCFHLAHYHMFLRDSPQDACRKGNGSKLSPRFEVFYLSKDSLQRHEWCDKWISKGRSRGGNKGWIGRKQRNRQKIDAHFVTSMPRVAPAKFTPSTWRSFCCMLMSPSRHMSHVKTCGMAAWFTIRLQK